MGRIIKELSNGSIVEFDSGSFDDWCVYLTRPNQARFAPTDVQYFSELNELGSSYSHSKIYQDFVKIYEVTSAKINSSTLELITTISNEYGSHASTIDEWFTVIYGGMIAEENKSFAILKKRIKRLGMHQVLIDGINPSTAAHFSRGKKWRELDVICREKGF
ncbi:hypothetical protein HZR84_03760 [Hyphobacterium sp. CCMP332]|nr:hypothetical protein HZR84_03760 [Hyphobacterium sp. CCMP332]